MDALDLHTFGETLAGHIGVDPGEALEPGSDLFAQWGIDSLQAFQVIVTIEAMADCAVPPPAIPEIFLLSDAYAYYRSLLAPAS